jgi:hypothetical protein
VLFKESALHGSFLLDTQLKRKLMLEVQGLVEGAKDKVAAAVHTTSHYLVEPLMRKITGVARKCR